MVSPSSVPASPGPTTASLGDWTAQELYLVAGIPDDIRATCAPTRPAEVTNAAAEVTCHPDEPLVDSIGYYLFTEDGAARQVYTDRLAEYDVHVEDRASGESCESGTPGERPQSPAADDVSAPRLGCFVNEFRVANLRALTPPFVYVGVLGTGGEIAPLDDWARGGDETLGAIPRVAVLWWPPEPTS